ncbi:MAG: metalloregulator ArsR/SmtB family transcription factor [Spirochaetes bacterium]|nr:metalloregulator ArsR/SmtB family transcription factor [Spirochaetota bacterium]
MKNNNFEICKNVIIHNDLVSKAKKNMPNDQLISEISEFFKVFSDPTRLKIVNTLFYSEMCVCDIASVLGMNISAISHQLRLLKQANLVKYRKDGKVVYYSLKDNHVKQIYKQGFLHITEKKE